MNNSVEFTQQMFVDYHHRLWRKYLSELFGKEKIEYLEIGAYEGQSLTWVMQNIWTHPSSRATVIEPFYAGTRKRFVQNLRSLGLAGRVRLIDKPSHQVLKFFKKDCVDLIYIDGDHTYKAVLQDAVAAWPLLKVGGYIIFDDYYWMKWSLDSKDRPQAAIDKFLKIVGKKGRCLEKGIQVIVQKKAELDEMMEIPLYSRGHSITLPGPAARWARGALYAYHIVKLDGPLNLPRLLKGLCLKVFRFRGGLW